MESIYRTINPEIQSELDKKEIEEEIEVQSGQVYDYFIEGDHYSDVGKEINKTVAWGLNQIFKNKLEEYPTDKKPKFETTRWDEKVVIDIPNSRNFIEVGSYYPDISEIAMENEMFDEREFVENVTGAIKQLITNIGVHVSDDIEKIKEDTMKNTRKKLKEVL